MEGWGWKGSLDWGQGLKDTWLEMHLGKADIRAMLSWWYHHTPRPGLLQAPRHNFIKTLWELMLTGSGKRVWWWITIYWFLPRILFSRKSSSLSCRAVVLTAEHASEWGVGELVKLDSNSVPLRQPLNSLRCCHSHPKDHTLEDQRCGELLPCDLRLSWGLFSHRSKRRHTLVCSWEKVRLGAGSNVVSFCKRWWNSNVERGRA